MRLGVALSSGGAAAMAQVGVLEVLVEAGIQVDCVAGTSGGAIVGAAFCNGRMGALRDAMCGLSRRRVLSLFDPTWPRMGMLEGRRAMEFVKPCLAGAIEALPVPYAALATDLDSGLPMALRRGDVSRAVRASVAIPGVLTPVHWGDRVLVDGALSEPIPVGTCRALGARFALAVSVLPLAEDVLRRRQRPPREPLMRAVQRLGGLVPGAGAPESDRAGDDAAGAGLAPSERRGLVQVILRASHVGQCQIAALRLREEPPDFLLTVPVPRAGLFDFHRSSELVEAGRRAARDALPALGEALRRAEPVAQRVGRWLAGGSG